MNDAAQSSALVPFLMHLLPGFEDWGYRPLQTAVNKSFTKKAPSSNQGHHVALAKADDQADVWSEAMSQEHRSPAGQSASLRVGMLEPPIKAFPMLKSQDELDGENGPARQSIRSHLHRILVIWGLRYRRRETAD